MNARTRVSELLESCGAVLKRRRKHEVYELPNGQNFVRASTPSDRRSDLNNLTDLKHQLKVVVPKKIGAAPSRAKLSKAKPRKTVSTERMKSRVASLSLAESLRMAGLTDDVLRDRVVQVEAQILHLAEQIREIEKLQDEFDRRFDAMWINRLQRWIESWLK